MKNLKPLISSLHILLAVIISIPLTAQLPTIDGHFCDSTNWGPPGGSDVCGDESSAPADFSEIYLVQDGDILYVGWERCANGAGTATYALLFDADCDGDADAAVYVEWGSQGGGCQSNVDVELHPGCNAGKAVIGSGITGTPLCPGGVPDCSEAGKFLEFTFDIQDVIAGLLICNDFDPCDCTCGEISLLGAFTLAGGSPNSAMKDAFDTYTFIYDSAGNKCPIANINIASTSICAGAPVNFNGEGSTDAKPHPADLNLDYAWDFGDGGSSTDSATTHTYATAGTYLVELTVTDVFGCIDMITQSVTVLANIPPVINTCAADLILECDEDYSAEIATWISNSNTTILSNTTDDRAATLSIMNDYVAPPDLSCDLSSGALITFTVTDDCGNTTSCAATIFIDDSTAPTITCPANLTVTYDATCMLAIDPILNTGEPTLADNCGTSTYTFADVNSLEGCNGTGTITRTFTVNDGCGNTATCEQIITIQDNTNPVLIAPSDVTVECGSEDLAAWIASASFTDNCDAVVDITNAIISTSNNCGTTSATNYLFTATDDCGNTATAVATYTVEDTSIPSITCPPDLTLECGDPNNVTMIATWLASANGSNSSICSAFMISDNYDGSNLSAACGGTLAVMFSIIDDCGNVGSDCIANIILEDNTPPTFTNCPVTDITVFVDPMECGSEVNISLPNATDFCNPSVTVTQTDGPPGNIFPLGSSMVEFTATDACGNTDICIYNIVVEDNEAPALNCPADFTVCVDPGTCTWVADNSSDITYMDNCIDAMAINMLGATGGSMSGTLAGQILNIGVNTIIYTVTDLAGNTASCSFDITVSDCYAPAFTCPSDITVECDGLGNMMDFDAWSDAEGILATVVENCPGVLDVNVMLFESTPSCGGSFTSRYLFEVSDAAGNSNTCLSSFTVVDTDVPTMDVFPADIIIECNANASDNLADWLGMNAGATASDVCNGPLSWSNNYTTGGVLDCTGAGTDVTFTVQDDCGNSISAIANFLILDSAAPVITCPADLTIECADPLEIALTDAFLNGATATDNCDSDITITNDYGVNFSPSCSSTGIHTVIFTATDDCGNTSTCEASITLNDTKDPIITCPAAVTVSYDLDCGLAIDPILDTGEPVMTDACGTPSYTFTDTSDLTACNNTGTIVRTFVSDDGCGNTASCAQVITVIDDTRPVIVCPADVTVFYDATCSLDTMPATIGIPVGSDNCDVTTFTYSDDISGLNGCGGNTGTVARTWTVTDACDNTAICIQNIQILDILAPVFTVDPMDTLVVCGPNTLNDFNTWLSNFGGGSVMDNCSSISTYTNPTVPALMTDWDVDGATSVWFVAEDACGNRDSIQATFNVSCINAAKAVSSVVPATTTGNFNVTYSIVVENTGNVNLDNISLEDVLDDASQLGTAFVMVVGDPSITASTATTDPMINVNYDGMLTNPAMLDGMSGLLLPDETITLQIVVEVDPDATGAPSPLQNQATASGNDPDGNGVTDDSDSGTNPESNNPGEPGDTGGEDDPTPLMIPSINAAKTVVGFVDAVSGTVGNLDVTFGIYIQNTGNQILDNITFVDDIASQFGSTFVTPPVPVISNISLTGSGVLPTANPSYDGGITNDSILLYSSGGILYPSDVLYLEITVEVDPNAIGAPDPLENQGTATGTDNNGTTVNDDTDSGIDPDGTNPNAPGDTGSSDDPTPILLPNVSLLKNFVSYEDAASGMAGQFDIVMQIGMANIGNTNLGNLDLFDQLDSPTNFDIYFAGIAPGFAPFILNSTATTNPSLNSIYNGTMAQPNLFDGMSGLLEPGQIITVELRFALDGSIAGIPDTLYNLVLGGGSVVDENGDLITDENGDPITTEDESDSGSDFEGTNPDAPGDMGTSDDPTPVPLLGKICGIIWEDCNRDGIRNDVAAGMEGVQVDVYKEDDTYVGSAITDATGYYILENLIPGNYYIKVDKPVGFSATDFRQGIVLSQDSDLDDSNGDCTTPSSYVGIGNCDAGDFDAGLWIYECISIGELVWYDINENDVKDIFENGINGLSIELWQEMNGVWSLYETQLTGHKPGTQSDDGYFKFCVPPGTYEIRIDLPSYGLVPTVRNSGAQGSLPLTNANESTVDSDVNFNQSTGSFTVNCDTGDLCNIGAGYYPQAQVGNRVWHDTNQDGLQSTNEQGVAGVMVEAYDANDQMINSDVTDANGEYLIDNLGKNDYYLMFTPPTQYGMTSPNMGGDEMMDSDVDNSNGSNTTSLISLNPGDDLPYIDAGLVFGVVPVEWLSFTGENRGSYNRLDWSTATEVNTNYYEIERAIDNTTAFVEIGKLAAAGNSTTVEEYTARDYDIEQSGVYYYRLKQVDFDGNYSYSKVVQIRIANTASEFGLDLYPNPAYNEVSIEMTVSKASVLNISIWDATGKLIRTNVFNEILEAGTTVKALDITNLTTGTYTVKVEMDNTSFQRKLIKIEN